jgi:hypothetical protein
MRPPQPDDLLDIPDEDDRDFAAPPASIRAPASVDDDLELDDEGDLEVEAGHTGHKKIPTWQDAVGILIDANMASRVNSPDRGHRGGRRGGGRGR